MTKSEFFKLPATRKGLALLSAQSLESKFYNEVARALRTYIQLPASVKKVTSKFSFEKQYNTYIELQKAGYRKDIILPF